MKIKSDDIVKLEKLYKVLDEEGIAVQKESAEGDGKGFIEFVIYINSVDTVTIHMTFIEILSVIGSIFGGAKLLMKKSSGEEEYIDAEIIKNPKSIENKKRIEALDIPKDSVLEIIE